MVEFLLIIYGILLAFILLYSLVQLTMLWQYQQAQKHEALPIGKLVEYPMVTVQLPMYNEKFVAERLINKIAALDYPKNRLEIQILDDSTDETSSIIKKALLNLDPSINFQHIQREERKGYKAGALAYGLKIAKGEFIGIFDADFMPSNDFLLKVIPQFTQDNIGMVQTRWTHLNEDFSLITKLQAFGLDAHFSVEQVGRNYGGHFINFNGTAGVWKKTCIEDAGGWEADTITEDLDLSYRAQSKGWKFKYLEEIASPAELPTNIYSLKSQQFRWTKGAAECFRKNIGLIFKTHLPFSTRLHAFFHLSNSFLFLAILLTSLISFPLLYVKVSSDTYDVWFKVGSIFILSLLILILVYRTSFLARGGDHKKFWYYFPLFLSVSMGLSLHNAIAVIEGYLGIKSPFVRTPKLSSVGKNLKESHEKKYVKPAFNGLMLFEFLFAAYFLSAVVYGISHYEFGLVPFHLMLAFGYCFVGFSALNFHLKQLYYKPSIKST